MSSSGKRKGSFLCDDCGEEFARKFNLARHISRIHCNQKSKTSKRTNSRIICPFCEAVCVTFVFLERHLFIEHGVDLKVTKFTLSSEAEFWQWKEKEESDSVSLFFRDRAYTRGNGDRVIGFTCNRSGVYRRRGKGQRMARAKGSCKMGYTCTARILARFETSGTVQVEYHSTHIGHDHQFCYLRLPTSQEKLIADKLKEGSNLDEILDEVRNEITASSTLEKKHFLNKKMLFNIVKKYSISGVKKSDRTGIRNAAPAETLLSECKEMSHNPILLYKKNGETHRLLDVEDVMIVIMNDVQIELIKKFAEERICIDNTNYIRKSHFKLIAVSVIDEYGEEFPCCFCITNRVNDITMSLLFETMKAVTGPLNTKVLISDDDPCYYVSWEKAMGKIETRLLSKWHVDEDWKSNLKLINDKQSKCEVYSKLRTLLEETDANKFLCLLNELLSDLREQGLHDFSNYFTSNYTYRPEVWASCYRSKEFLNHDMVLEASHRLLKHIHLKGIKQQNCNILLHMLFKAIREKVFTRLRCMEDCTGTSYTEKLYKRHRRRHEVKDISLVESNQWHVKCDRQKGTIYIVKLETESCACKRKCPRCSVCVHMYSCTCNDYLINHNLCKHIHSIAMRNVQDVKDDSEGSMVIDTNEIVVENVCQVLEIGNWMTKESKNNLIDKLSQCIDLLKETDSENITLEMEDQMNNNADNILRLLYENSKVTVESVF